jgi:hypothetical protein
MSKSKLEITRREYLMMECQATTGCSWEVAAEAVASTALGHPDWDMEELAPVNEWSAHR